MSCVFNENDCMRSIDVIPNYRKENEYGYEGTKDYGKPSSARHY
ncbi:MAG: hypothetical protein K0S80_3179 [Neobacillus sp.]|nr:hypothetical protein [Neobacillus sp.]